MESASVNFHFYSTWILGGLTHGAVGRITGVVFGPLGAVLYQIQVPAGGVEGVVAHVDRPLYVTHVSLPDLDYCVIGQLKETKTQIWIIVSLGS